MLKSLLLLGVILLLAGCVTTPATPEELAYCQRMSNRMGTTPRHDHGATKGTPPSGMGVEHRRCREILRQLRQTRFTLPGSGAAGAAR